jgi:hypothetical protein
MDLVAWRTLVPAPVVIVALVTLKPELIGDQALVPIVPLLAISLPLRPLPVFPLLAVSLLLQPLVLHLLPLVFLSLRPLMVPLLIVSLLVVSLLIVHRAASDLESTGAKRSRERYGDSECYDSKYFFHFFSLRNGSEDRRGDLYGSTLT